LASAPNAGVAHTSAASTMAECRIMIVGPLVRNEERRYIELNIT
jgi:hypothetical protein